MQLHPKWEGVWEIRGNSRWNGERMVITLSPDECVMTDSRSFDEYQLTSGPESNLSAHWDFRPSGKAKRYYIGALLRDRDYDEIEWTELCKKRRTDKWIRIRSADPAHFLEQCRSRKPSQNNKARHAQSQSQSQPRTIIRRKQQNQEKNQNQNDENAGGHSNKAATKYVSKMKKVSPAHNRRQPNPQSPAHIDKAHENQFMDPAIMNMGHAQPPHPHPQRDQPPHQPRAHKKYQTKHRAPKGQFDVEYYPNEENEYNEYEPHSNSKRYRQHSHSHSQHRPHRERGYHQNQHPHHHRERDQQQHNYEHDSPPMPQHKQSAVPPMNWGLVSRLDLQPRVRDDDQPSMQNRHEKHIHKLLCAQKNSVPRRTTFRHQGPAQGTYQLKEQRQMRPRMQLQSGQHNKHNQQQNSQSNRQNNKQRPERVNNNNQKNGNGRRNKNRFSPHLPPSEVDRLMADTAHFSNAVVYIGEVSLSRYNPNVAYVSVDGLARDIRVSGFVDRNRAFHGDTVAVTIYPKVEWMQVIKQDIIDLKNVLDERDRNRLLEEAAEDAALNEAVASVALEVEVEVDADDFAMLPDRVVEVVSGDNHASPDQEPEQTDPEEQTEQEASGSGTGSGSSGTDADADADVTDADAQEEIIFFDDTDDSEKEKNGKAEASDTQPITQTEKVITNELEIDDTAAAATKDEAEVESDEKDDEKTSSKDKDDEQNDEKKEVKEKEEKEAKEKKSQEALFSKKRRKDKMEALKDPTSITAFDHFVFLKETAADFAKFTDQWPSLSLTDENHPRREYIDSVLTKLNDQRPDDLLVDFAWSSPSAHPNLMPRGKVISIYRAKRETKCAVPGFIVPSTRGPRGEIDRKWATFTPSDRRFPRAQFPMRELPASLKQLFYAFEREEMEIVEETDNMQYELRRQGREHKDAEAMCKKRRNKFLGELKLMTFEADFEHKWPDHCFMPVCHLRRELGKRGAVETETRHILSSHSISWDHTFDAQIEQYVKDMDITEKDFVNRKDCRDLRVFSIDPTSARDFDDALSIEPILGGDEPTFRVGIHIADVTHFVAPGSVVDLEARRRATSVYLVDRCLPMLPHHLCQNLCSLNPDVDRLAYSVFVELDAKGRVVEGTKDAPNPWFGKTVIRSRARLNYETAHWMLEGKVTGETPHSALDECCQISADTSLAEIVADTRLLWSIAKERRADRFKDGSVQFFRPHLRFRLDPSDDKKALAFGPEILLFSNNLIEEFMLLANQLVAHQLVLKARQRCVLRRHPAPLADKAMKLKLICRSQNLDLDLSSPGALNASLEAMSHVSYGGISAAKAINALLAPTMQRAQYIIVADSPESEWTHWALNFPLYTHFTSPIRRYADVMVHRLLTATLATDDAERAKAMAAMPSVTAMQKQCAVCNDRNAAAHFAEMDSQKVHLCLVLMEKPIVVDVLVIDIFRGRFVVVVPGLGLDQRVTIRDVIEESKGALVSVRKENELPDSVLVVKWRSGEVEEYRLFDKMRLRLSSRLKIPIQPVVQMIEPSKRRYTRAVNATAVLEGRDPEEEEEDGQEEQNAEEDVDADEVEVPEECKSPVAMTLDEQREIGKSDYHNAHYD